MNDWIKNINNDKTIIVIGRGHGGTRAMAQLLRLNGVFTGHPRNAIEEDLIPPEPLYDVCRLYAKDKNVTQDKLDLLEKYLQSVINYNGYKGWKLPENTLIFPLLTQVFPDAKFIWWTRHINENIIKHHITDNLEDFGLEKTTRQESWNYQTKIVLDAVKPKHFLHVKFEDFLLYNEYTIRILENFIGINLNPIPISKCKAYYGNNLKLGDDGYVDKTNRETIELLRRLKYHTNL